MSDPVRLSRRQSVLQTLKYAGFMCSAGAIQIGVFTLLTELNVFGDRANPYGPSYFIALALSVVWNFTFNRKFTFKSAANYPIAMLKVFGYYLVFTPLSLWWGNALTAKDPASRWLPYAVLLGTMVINGVTEFLFQRFVVFRNSINTNPSGQKEEAAKHDSVL
ncbi:MAG: GtrA family protein [Oscillospiraceae bacterium]|jgi:putative flippase GtrA|nr:GtrA family protein [Oscillospiraceae bacterium]